jgi:undecaprenyl-diphosphatase
LDLLEAIILGIVQGATEFLPVSSSGHLVLVSWWLNIDTPPLVFSVVVHVGTTVAVLAYFWREWYQLLLAAVRAIRTRNFSLQDNTELRLLALLIFGTIPAGVAGLLLADFFEDQFSEPAIVSLALLITAALLVYGERIRNLELSGEDILRSDDISFRDSFIIGCAQALAIMPGISRSGSTIAAGLFRNLSRAAATRYSFLLATPIILAAGALQMLDLITGEAEVGDNGAGVLLAGFVTSAVVGYICIALMLRLVRNRSLNGFAVYCVVFGLISFGAVMVRG